MQLFNLSGVDRQWNLAIDGRKSNSDLWDSINWKKSKTGCKVFANTYREGSKILPGALRCLINA